MGGFNNTVLARIGLTECVNKVCGTGRVTKQAPRRNTPWPAEPRSGKWRKSSKGGCPLSPLSATRGTGKFLGLQVANGDF